MTCMCYVVKIFKCKERTTQIMFFRLRVLFSIPIIIQYSKSQYYVHNYHGNCNNYVCRLSQYRFFHYHTSTQHDEWRTDHQGLTVFIVVSSHTAPEAPEYVIATNSDRGTIGLKWQPSSPRLCDGGVDHYTVQYSLVGGNTTSRNVTGTSIVLSNLEAGATYEIVVFATNRIASSKKSQKILVNTTAISVGMFACAT